MPKWDAIGFGADLADVEPEEGFTVYDEATLGVPPKGVYRMVVKRFRAGETGENSQNPGSPKVILLMEIAEPKGTKKYKYNGYGIWLHRAVTKENANRTNQMLLALLGGTKLTDAKKKAVLKAWHEGKVVLDDDENITKIGTWAVPDGLEVAASTRDDNYGGEKRLQIGSLISIADAPAPVSADPDDEEELEDEELADDESDEYEEEDEDVEEDEDEEELDEDEESEEDARAAELAEMNRTALKKLLKELDPEFKVTTKTTDEQLAEAILDLEFAEPEDEEEEEPEEEAEEDEEDEPEPEPAKPARRAPSGRGKAAPAAKARPAATRRRGKKADDDEPPF